MDEEEHRYARAFEALYDPVTFRHLDGLSIVEGSRCLVIGPGVASVAGWLAQRVGRAGSVVAALGDFGDAGGFEAPNVEVRHQDLARDELPSRDFDLVHARFSLAQFPNREEVLARMVASLRPGGRLLAEDHDPVALTACLEENTVDELLANRVRQGFVALLSQRGVDLQFGRKLPRMLRSLGLIDVEADAFLPLSHPGVAELERAEVSRVRDVLVGLGQLRAEEIDRYMAALAEGMLDVARPLFVSAWGRNPK